MRSTRRDDEIAETLDLIVGSYLAGIRDGDASHLGMTGAQLAAMEQQALALPRDLPPHRLAAELLRIAQESLGPDRAAGDDP